MTTPTAAELTVEDIHHLFERCCNWGRWGPDDQRGALNFISNQTVQRATSLVREGFSVGCGLPLATKPAPGNPRPVTHLMESAGDMDADSQDYVGISFHGFANTHIDALCHVFYNDQMYNGRPKSDVTSQGAVSNAIDIARDGIVSRGVLLDVPRSLGLDWLEPGAPIMVADLERAGAAAGLEVREGDILLVRTGRHARIRASQTPLAPVPIAGLHASTLSWLHERRIAVLGGDGVNDVLPSGISGYRPPIHGVAIPGIGLHLIDNADLEALSVACGRLRRWEFLLVISPWVLLKGTGGPVNPIAVF